MDKLLTISIAAYNSEKYIRKTLESLLTTKYIEFLEIFVIDDGGEDSTLDIAKEYHKRYPNSVFDIHKKNGGYGSTVNYSIAHARGKYFKLLDGDDWFNSKEFNKLLDILANEDSDVIVGNYYLGFDDEHMKLNLTHKEKEGCIIDLREGYSTNKPYNMWEIVYKTSVLRSCGMILPQKMLYTDRYYFTVPFAYANSLRFTDAAPYCYRIGRDGQSMSLESQIQHFSERVKGVLDLCEFYEEQKRVNNPRCSYLLASVSRCHVAVASLIRKMPKSSANKTVLKDYENKVLSASKDVVKAEYRNGKSGKFIALCRMSNYLLYSLTPERILKMTSSKSKL